MQSENSHTRKKNAYDREVKRWLKDFMLIAVMAMILLLNSSFLGMQRVLADNEVLHNVNHYILDGLSVFYTMMMLAVMVPMARLWKRGRHGEPSECQREHWAIRALKVPTWLAVNTLATFAIITLVADWFL